MTTKEFKIKKNEFFKRTLTTLQHKLKVMMKCYTVSDFILNEQNNTFTFKKSHKINGLRMNDSKEYKAQFEIEDMENGEINLRIIVN